MTKRDSTSSVGRNLFMRLAIATLPLAACDLPADVADVPADAVSTQERAQFDDALASRDAAKAAQFVRDFPQSALIPRVLNSLPPSQLRRLSPALVRGVDAAILARLSPPVKRQLGLIQQPSGGNGSGGNADGYGN